MARHELLALLLGAVGVIGLIGGLIRSILRGEDDEHDDFGGAR
jgi:hypothetical protein